MKRKSALLIVLMMLASFTAGAETLRGDVDQDGRVNIADVTALIDYLLTGAWEEPVTPPAEGDWVDLGLPSGTLWATRNVGASAPEDYGDYFAWGETEPKDNYGWNTYKWCNGSSNTLTKYCTNSSYGYDGFVDNKTELDPSDDAACAHYPGGRMPSLVQIRELCDNCTWQWTQRNGVKGQLVTGPNGNTMFLPAAGYREYESLYLVGSYGCYWSRPLDSSGPYSAYCLYFGSGRVYWGNYHGSRYFGFTVRAVRVS